MRVECGQELGASTAAREVQRGDFEEDAEEGNPDGNQVQNQQRQSLSFAHRLEQPIESQADENEAGEADQLGPHAHAEETLEAPNAIGGRGGVSLHEELAGNVKERERAWQAEQEVEQPGPPSGLLGF